MCYTDKVFQFKVLGHAWEVVNEGQTFTHQVTDVAPRLTKVKDLGEPVTIKIEPKLYTVVAGHTCPSEWGSWDGRSGFLVFYQGLHAAEDLGFVGETTWREGEGCRSGPGDHPDLVEDYLTPYQDYQAGMCDLAAKLIQVTGVNPRHLLFWTGSSREWGPALIKRESNAWNTYWEGFAAAKVVDSDPWAVWYDLRDPYSFYPNLIHLNHCEAPVTAVRDLSLTGAWASARVIEDGLKHHFGEGEAYRDWQKKVWQREWPPTFWVVNSLVELEEALEGAPSAEAWQDRRYLVIDDFGVQVLVSHQPALALLEKLQELGYVNWNQLIPLKGTEEGDNRDEC